MNRATLAQRIVVTGSALALLAGPVPLRPTALAHLPGQIAKLTDAIDGADNQEFEGSVSGTVDDLDIVRANGGDRVSQLRFVPLSACNVISGCTD